MPHSSVKRVITILIVLLMSSSCIHIILIERVRSIEIPPEQIIIDSYIESTPLADFAFTPLHPTIQDIITFMDTSQNSNGCIVNWTWDFNDGNISYIQNPTHQYTKRGTYHVALTVRDDHGQISSTFQDLVLINLPPTALILYTVEGNRIFCDASSSYDFDGTIIQYEWDFGDSTIGNGITVNHTFFAGTYNITLRVTDDCNDTNTSVITVVIEEETVSDELINPPQAEEGQQPRYENVKQMEASASPMWWNFQWGYRKEIYLINPQPNYQLAFTLFKEDGHDDISNGIIDCENHCNIDFSDIRFIDGDGTTDLSYWIEQIDVKDHDHIAYVWVKTLGTSTIYLYFGNTQAADQSNGRDTFLFFDDFTQDVIADYTQYSSSNADWYIRSDTDQTNRRMRWKSLLFDLQGLYSYRGGTVYYGACAQSSQEIGDFIELQMSYNHNDGATDTQPAVRFITGDATGTCSSLIEKPIVKGKNNLFEIAVLGGQSASAMIYTMDHQLIWSQTHTKNIPQSLQYQLIEHYRYTDKCAASEALGWLASSHELQSRCVGGNKQDCWCSAFIENRFDWWFVASYADPEPIGGWLGGESENPFNVDQTMMIEAQNQDDGHIQLTFTNGKITVGDLTINNEKYYTLDLEGESHLLQEGYPELPQICRSLIIPDSSQMNAAILSSEYIDFEQITLAPSKGNLLRSENPDEIPYQFHEIYQEDQWYPEQIISLREPYILRDFRGQVIEINAFQYNPMRKILRVYTKITCDIAPEGEDETNIFIRTCPLTTLDSEFTPVYQSHFLNFDPALYTPVEEQGSMLVITYDSFYDTMVPFVQWKNQEGIPTEMVKVSEIGGATAIQAYIREYYTTQGLTFVLLVGDVEQIPTLRTSAGGLSDPSYSYIVGNDHYPDVFVGRFSAQNIAQLQTQVDRSISYEKTPQVGASWYEKGMGIASSQGPGDDGEYDYQHIRYIRTKLLNYYYTGVDELYDGSQGGQDVSGNPTKTMVASSLNAGRGIINYCGHGSASSWGTTGFSTTDITTLLTNDNMLPFIWSVACQNGRFDVEPCFAEAWLRATHSGEPIGAIGVFMSSVNQYWNPPMDAQDEFVDLLRESYTFNKKNTFGGISFTGCMHMNDQYGSAGYDMTDTWHVFGDPSLQVRTRTPQPITVLHDSHITNWATTFQVDVPGVSNALCALSQDGILLGNGYADATGHAIINFFNPLISSGTLDLVVTAYNKIPYITTIIIDEGEEPIFWVDDDYDESTPRWGIDHFASIQEAINHASPGDLIYVYAGIYYENLFVSQSVSIMGENKETTIVAGDGTADVVHIVANYCSLRSITIRDSGKYNTGIKILSANTIIRDIIISGNYYGVWVEGGENTTLSNTIIQNNAGGVKLRNTTNTTLLRNQISRNTMKGLDIESSLQAHVLENIFEKNGIALSGPFVAWTSHTIENNTVNDKPIYYLKNQIGGIVPDDAGEIILANCRGITIQNASISDIETGIQIGYSSEITIKQVSFQNVTFHAIQLYHATGNMLHQNTFSGGTGIDLWRSIYTTITENVMTKTTIGMNIFDSSDNIIILNTLYENSFGILIHSYSCRNQFSYNNLFNNAFGGFWIMDHCAGNMFGNNSIDSNGAWNPHQANVIITGNCSNNYFMDNTISSEGKTGIYIDQDIGQFLNNSFVHNNFINNTIQAYDTGTDTWDQGYSIGGNYWSDFDEPGEGAYDLNNDGFVDSPYYIPGTGGNQDHYPFIVRSGWNLPPNPPSNPEPPANSTGINITTILRWVCSDPEEDPLWYDVYFGMDPQPPLVLANLPLTEYNPGILQYDTTYYWRIVARDFIHLTTTDGPLWSFTTANSPPYPDFSWTSEQLLVNYPITFTDLSWDHNGQIISWFWSFGDGTTSTEQHPVHRYAQRGTYSVSLQVTDDDHTIRSVTKSISIGLAPPVAAFTYSPTSIKMHMDIQFTDGSTDPDGSIIQWIWNFGDGHVSYEKNPIYSFTSAGNYVITLQVYDNDYLTDNCTQTIQVSSDAVYTTDFETPTSPEWKTYTSASGFGRNERTTLSAGSGSWSWRMDVNKDNTLNLNELILHVSVHNATYLILSFSTKEYSDEQHLLPETFTDHYNGDGIALSTDGFLWYTLWQYPSSVGSWTTYGPVDITNISQITGDVYIKFQQYDNVQIPTDGILWDDITLYSDGTVTPVQTPQIPPTADFTYSPQDPMTTDLITFTDQSIDLDGSISSWTWNFGDYTYSTSQHPSHQYLLPGYYTVTLTVLDDDGLSNILSKQLTIGNFKPEAWFAYLPTNPKVNEPVFFIDQSLDSDGSITSWLWNFGDGTTSIEQNPTHRYTSARGYVVTLTVTDDDEATDTTTETIFVQVNNFPNADAGGPYTARIDEPIDLDASQSSDVDGTITGYRWDFDNDGIYDTNWETDPIITQSFSQIGTWTIVLQVKDNDGAIDEDTASLTVYSNLPPTADAGGPYSGRRQTLIQFDASNSFDPDGTIDGYRWDYQNDGIWDTDWLSSPTSSYTYSTPGASLVKVEVMDNEGSTDVGTASLMIYSNMPPTAEAAGPYYRRVSTPILFDASQSTDPDGTIANYRWDFNNDGIYDTSWLTSPTTSYSYSQTGSYLVKLQVKDNDGATDVDTTLASITQNIAPVADAGGPYLAHPASQITLTASSSYDVDGTIVAYRWDFTNDGLYDTGWLSISTVQTSYSTEGNYIIKVEVKDNEGATKTDTAQITIAMNILPIAHAGGPYQGTPSSLIRLDASSSYDLDGVITGYRWDYDYDGVWDTSWVTTPLDYHMFSEGVHTIALEIIDDDSAVDTAISQVTITSIVPPVASISGPSYAHVNEKVSFDASDSYDPDGVIIGYRWDFDGDGIYDTMWKQDSSAFHYYTTPGLFTVSVQVKDSDSAASTDTTIVKITDSYLEGHWHLNENSGAIAFDSSGNEKHGNVHNALWVEGKYGNALSLNGASSYVDIPGISTSYTAFTVSLWAKHFDSSSDQTLISRLDGTGVGRDILKIQGGKLCSFIGGGTGIITDFTPSLSVWYHYVLTYNDGTVKIYVNANTTCTSSVHEEAASGAFILGAGTQYSSMFHGMIDEVAIWSKVLSLSEIMNLYTVPNPPTFENPANQSQWVDPDIGRLSVVVSESYTFPSPEILEIEIAGTRYDQVTLGNTDGTGYGEPGAPCLPARGINLVLPPQTRVDDITVIGNNWRSLGSGYIVEPIATPSMMSEDTPASPPTIDEEIYKSENLYPGSLFTYIGTYNYRGYTIVVLTLHPIQYSPSSGELFYYEELFVSIDSVNDEEMNPLYRARTADRDVVEHIVDNEGVMDYYTMLNVESLDRITYDLVIITSTSLKSGFEPLKQAHDAEGMQTLIVTVEDIYSQYTGCDNQEKIRNFIKDAYATYDISYVLLGGDDDIVPSRKLFFGTYYGYEYHGPSDTYYACLDGTFNADGDSRWGESHDGPGGSDVDLFAEVYVGRACVGSISEVNNFVQKTIAYMTVDKDDEYLKNVLFVGEYLGFGGVAEWGGNYKDEMIDGSSSSYYTTVGIPSDEYSIQTLYERDGSWSVSMLQSHMNEGIHFINHLGHANYQINMKMTSSDVGSLTNDKYCFIYSQGCNAGGFDYPYMDCIAEDFTVKTAQGAFAGIWNARYGWGTYYSTDGPSQRYDREFWDAVFGEGISEIGRANQDSKEDNVYRINAPCMRWCYYELNLFGDPTLDFLDHEEPSEEVEQPGELTVKFYWGNSTLIGMDTGVKNNSLASVDIGTLPRYTNITWYVVITDGIHQVTGPRWWFTTEAYNWDINRDGRVDDCDAKRLIEHYGETGAIGWIREDILRDGIIDIGDLSRFITHYGESYFVEFVQNIAEKTITVRNIYREGLTWNDLRVTGTATMQGLDSLVRVGDQLTDCTGVLTIEYLPVRTVQWAWSFSDESSPPSGGSDGDDTSRDITNDGIIDESDIEQITKHYDETGEPGWIPEDINSDGSINFLDIEVILSGIQDENQESNENGDSYDIDVPSPSPPSNEASNEENVGEEFESDEPAFINNFNGGNDMITEIITIAQVEVDQKSMSLISTDNDRIPEYILDSVTENKIPVTYAPAVISNVAHDQKEENIIVMISVKKANWIYIEVEDKYPTISEIFIETSDGRRISKDMIWRENGKLFILDDPDIEYRIIYHYTEHYQQFAQQLPPDMTLPTGPGVLPWGLIPIVLAVGIMVIICRKKRHPKRSLTNYTVLQDASESFHIGDGQQKLNNDVFFVDAKTRLLMMVNSGCDDVDVVIEKLGVSVDDVKLLVDELVQIGMMKFISDYDAEITEKGKLYIEKYKDTVSSY